MKSGAQSPSSVVEQSPNKKRQTIDWAATQQFQLDRDFEFLLHPSLFPSRLFAFAGSRRPLLQMMWLCVQNSADTKQI